MDSQRIILVVDDEETNRQVLKRQIESLGYRSMEAGDGEEALLLIQSKPPDLILLDINMPKINGKTLLKKIKADPRNRHIPVVIISGDNDQEAINLCIESGADDYLLKPPNFSLLKARIRAGIEKKRLHDAEMESLQKEKTFNLSLKELVQEGNQLLTQAYIDTLQRLVLAAELKDEETGDHLLRMSRYCTALAKKAGISDALVENLRHASPLHDVGKIGIPDHILRKPGKLDEDEFAVMRKHTIIGAEILANSRAEVIQIAQRIALTHHEKWDGSGYPNRLAGKNIPLEGRIVALADVLDALTSKRPYKDPYPMDVVCEIIERDKGKHFDPDLVPLFLACVDEFKAIRVETGGDPEPTKFKWSERDQQKS